MLIYKMELNFGNSLNNALVPLPNTVVSLLNPLVSLWHLLN